MKNEKTSARVAKLAGTILKRTELMLPRDPLLAHDGVQACTVAQLRTLAASCLTQAPDRRKK